MTHILQKLRDDVERLPAWQHEGDNDAWTSARGVLALIDAAIADMPEPDELVKRLQRADEYEPLGHEAWEAADLITSQQAENAELRGKLGHAEAALMMISRNPVSFSHAASEVARADLIEQANIGSPVRSEMAKMVDPRKDEK